MQETALHKAITLLIQAFTRPSQDGFLQMPNIFPNKHKISMMRAHHNLLTRGKEKLSIQVLSVIPQLQVL
jgi:hypothetical protein